MNENNIYSPPKADLEVSVNSNLASRWARLGGSIIDGVVVMIVLGPVIYFTGYWERAMSGEVPISDTVIYELFGLAVYLFLNGYLLSKYGQTIGKRVMGIKIVSVDTNEIVPLWKVFFVRYCSQILVVNIPLVGSFILIVDYLIIFRKNKRCIHDLIAATKVIKASAY